MTPLGGGQLALRQRGSEKSSLSLFDAPSGLRLVSSLLHLHGGTCYPLFSSANLTCHQDGGLEPAICHMPSITRVTFVMASNQGTLALCESVKGARRRVRARCRLFLCLGRPHISHQNIEQRTWPWPWDTTINPIAGGAVG